MNKLYQRLLGSLVVSITILSLVCFAIFQLFNQVRFDQYWSDLVAAPMRFMVEQQRESGLYRAEMAPVPLRSGMIDSLDISEVDRQRLIAGQVVLDLEGMERYAWIALDGRQYVELSLTPLYGNLGQLTAWLVRNALSETEELDDSEMNRVAEALGIHIRPVRNMDEIRSDRVLESLAQNNLYLHWGAARDDGHLAYLKLDSGEILRLDFPDSFDPMSWPMIFLMIGLVLIFMATLVYFALQVFESRLRSIETVASRISRGELEARVKASDQQDAIGRLGKAFNSMADHIQRLMYVQKEMIHAVSHELRTPVARIRFGVQMIEDCSSEEARSKQLAGIDSDIQELDELIDEILTYARLEQGGPVLAFQQANVKAIVEQVVSEQGSTKPDMKIVAEFNRGSDRWKMSEVEQRYIHRSIQNLVGNATRYAKSTVKVICAFDAETCRVDVEDDGPGIPEDEWETVFTPFARLDDSRTRSSGGYGLGLSIVRRILYWHGGQAFLGRSEMGGAKFSLVWPRMQAQLTSSD